MLWFGIFGLRFVEIKDCRGVHIGFLGLGLRGWGILGGPIDFQVHVGPGQPVSLSASAAKSPP
jgi:hypothetical protein